MVPATAFPVSPLKPHIALNVRNVERSVAFYRALFGIEPSKVREGYAKFNILSPALNLSLNEVPFTDRGALSHLGIQLASSEDVVAVKHAWESAGLTTRDEMQTNCCYAIQDKTWATDPDGNEWEAFVVLEDNLSETTMCCLPDSTKNLAESEGIQFIKTAAESSVCCEPGSGCC